MQTASTFLPLASQLAFYATMCYWLDGSCAAPVNQHQGSYRPYQYNILALSSKLLKCDVYSESLMNLRYVVESFINN